MTTAKYLSPARATIVYFVISSVFILSAELFLLNETNWTHILIHWIYAPITSMLLFPALKWHENKYKKIKTQEEYSELLKNVPAVIFTEYFSDPPGQENYYYTSPRVIDLVGYSDSEWDNRMWANALHPDDKERVNAENKRTNQTGDPFQMEYRLRHKGGHYVWIKENTMLVKDENGKPIFWQGVLLDITEQKKAEEISRKRDEILRNASLELTNYTNLENLFEKIFTTLDKLIAFDSASIEFISNGNIEIVAGRNIPKELIGKQYPFSTNTWGGPEAVRKAIVVGDVHQDERFTMFDETNYIRSWIGVPLMVQEKLIGFLNLDSRTPHYFKEDTASLVQTFANQATIAIENSRLFELEKKRVEISETVRQAATALANELNLHSLYKAILEWLYKITPYDSASILEIEGDHLRVTAEKGLPSPEKALNQVFPLDDVLLTIVRETGQTVIIDDCMLDPRFEKWGDTDHIRGWMGVPLITRGQVIGYITIDSIQPNAFNQSDAIAAQTFAQQAAVALENVRLYSETRQRLAELEMVSRISFALRAAKDTNEMFPILLEEVKSIFQTNAVSLFLYDKETNTLKARANSGWLSKLPRPSLSVNEGIIGKVYSTGTVHISPDLLTDPIANINNASFFGAGWSCIAVPIRTANEITGVIISSVKKPRQLEKSDARLLTTIAEIAGNAIYRSTLFQKNEEQIRRLTDLAIDNAQLFTSLQNTNQELSLAYDTTLEGWGKALELRDKETQGHTQRVTNLTLKLAQQMRILEPNLTYLRRGALLHDIGKMGVPDGILRKPSKLTEEEMNEMKKHTLYAYDLLYPIPYLRSALDIPYGHHEWWDGSGYPQGLKGEEIPLAARVFAIVDVWDALLSDRPYRKAWKQEDVLNYILNLSGKQFDPRVVSEFQEMLKIESDLIKANMPKVEA